ncbi:MAG: hypothetical protein H0U74_10695 [Bradymonadaceae bacterium]|nr:hypothetical protein [Lujinxingiaceae bacterium]
MDHYTEHFDSPDRLELRNRAGLASLKMRFLGTLGLLGMFALLIYESTLRPKPSTLYESGLPMAVELARALNVPWFWEEFHPLPGDDDDGPATRCARRSWGSFRAYALNSAPSTHACVATTRAPRRPHLARKRLCSTSARR